LTTVDQADGIKKLEIYLVVYPLLRIFAIEHRLDVQE
jgi:hypothetical protein